jgi:SET domain-containing protein
MFIIDTYLAPSAIHGQGVFTRQPVACGQVVSRFMPPFDVHFPAELLKSLSAAERLYLLHYSYLSLFTRLYVLPGDNDRYMNHSENPNVGMNPSGAADNLALRDIASGEELTCDYRTFDADWREKLGLPCDC